MVAFVFNILPSLLNHKTPYEFIFNQTPSYNQQCVFGCLCFTLTLTSHHSKFDPQARRVFIDYPFEAKGYKLLDLDTFDAFISQVFCKK